MKNTCKRILICGHCCSGKNTLREMFIQHTNYTLNVSYTTRSARKNEVDGKDYHFVSEEHLSKLELFEVNRFGKYNYATSMDNWNNKQIFITSPSLINKLSEKDREESFVIYLNIEQKVRYERMLAIREMSFEQIMRRLSNDIKEFQDFQQYDIQITDSQFTWNKHISNNKIII